MTDSRHLLIYGPPGAGKFTVATAIAERFDVHVLDNHVAVDAVLRLFDFGDTGFVALVQTIRVAMLEAAAQHGRDVVSTFAFAYGADEPALQELLDASTRHGSRVTVAQLLPAPDELRRRALSEARRSTNKISDPELFDEVHAKYDLRTPFEHTDVVVDNTAVAAPAVAEYLAGLVGFRRRNQDPT